jgi:hypothetical protein
VAWVCLLVLYHQIWLDFGAEFLAIRILKPVLFVRGWRVAILEAYNGLLELVPRLLQLCAHRTSGALPLGVLKQEDDRG